MESKKTFIVGLVLALAVAWFGTATSSVGANDQFGAWVWVNECTACNGETNTDCYYGPGFYCNHNMVDVCNVANDGSGRTCNMTSNYPCGGSAACASAIETDCGY